MIAVIGRFERSMSQRGGLCFAGWIFRCDSDSSATEISRRVARAMFAASRLYMGLFNSHPYIQDGLIRSDLASRKIFVLDNPYLSEGDRRIPGKYWMS